MNKFKNKIGIVPVVILIVLGIVVVGVVYGAYRSANQKQNPLPSSGKPIETVQPTIGTKPTGLEKKAEPESALKKGNFSKEGNLLNQTEGDFKGWILLYEEPGNPAVDAILKFTDESLCDLGKGEEKCDSSLFEHGSRVNIEGNKSGKEVTVLKLKKL